MLVFFVFLKKWSY